MLRGKNITATGSGSITGPAGLWSVNVNTGAASAVLTIYNGSTTTNPIATIDASKSMSLWYGIFCDRGIYYQLSGGNADITIGFD